MDYHKGPKDEDKYYLNADSLKGLDGMLGKYKSGNNNYGETDEVHTYKSSSIKSDREPAYKLKFSNRVQWEATMQERYAHLFKQGYKYVATCLPQMAMSTLAAATNNGVEAAVGEQAFNEDGTDDPRNWVVFIKTPRNR